jgi:hypothetical protein
MKPYIIKNKKSTTALYNLINSESYSGYIYEDNFVFSRKTIPQNHRIIGQLNHENEFRIKCELINSFMEISARITFLILSLLSLYLFIISIWQAATFILVFSSVFLIFEIRKRQKEVTLFMDSYNSIRYGNKT